MTPLARNNLARNNLLAAGDPLTEVQREAENGLAFAQKGWRVRVHEQDSALRILGDGIYIWENGLRVLDALGVLPRVTAGVIPASRHEKRNHNGGAFASGRVGRDFRLYVPLRETLLKALHEALVATGGEVVFNSRAMAGIGRRRVLVATAVSSPGN